MLDRKKKALSLPAEDREKFIDEYNRIDKQVKEQFMQYAFYKIQWGLEPADEERVCMILDCPTLWGKVLDLRDLGEGERIDIILNGMKELYKAIKEVSI